jgi:hypothetical protein
MAKQKQHDPTDGLPEAGHSRREELKRRADKLMAEAELLMSEYEREPIDPAKLDPANIENEIRQAMNIHSEVWVSNANPNYRYAWIYRDPYNKYGGRFVHQMTAQGWERVVGDMQEAREHGRTSTGERWVADCLLLRCRLDRYAALKLADRETRARRHDGITSQFFETAARRGVKVFDQNTMPEHIRGYMENMAGERQASRPLAHPARGRGMVVPPSRVLRAQAAQRLAMDKLAHQVRQGTVPGLKPEDTVRR